MKRIQQSLFFFFFSCSLILSFRSTGQYYYYDNKYYDNDVLFEIGAGIGGMNCITDVGGAKSKNGFYINELSTKNYKANTNFYVGAMYQQMLGVTLQGTYGNVQGYDSILKGVSGPTRFRYSGRNASFRSTIREIALLVEFHPLALRYNDNGPSKFSPYVLAGLGWFSFNPQTKLNGQWIDLKPLSTEGQGFAEYKEREPYHLSQANVPLGVGLKYDLSPLFNLRAEFVHRVTFTDYLDDVSLTFIDPSLFDAHLSPIKAAQARAIYNRAPTLPPSGEPRGNPKSNDSYMSINIKLGFVLGREKR